MKKLLYTLAAVSLSHLAIGQTPNTNNVKTTTYQVKTLNGTTNATTSQNLTDDEKIESITYFDGLGRPVQSIAKQAGGNKQDIITPVVYDEFGRQTREYLPFARGTSSLNFETSLLPNIDGDIIAINTFYNNKYPSDFVGMSINAVNPFSEKHLEASPLNRVLEQGAPGKDWKIGNGHEIEMAYQSNTATEVRRYEVSLSFANNTYTPTLVLNTAAGNNNGYYMTNELYKTVVKDENHDGSITKNHTTEEFKDKQGQVILKRTYGTSKVNGVVQNNVSHDTYYVYDIYGNLTYVLPPKSEPQSAKPDATELSELCYQYKYDQLNRLVEKKVPGKGWEYIVYNNLDQPILTQDAVQKVLNKWLFTKYDAFGRVAYTGEMTRNISRTALQAEANGISSQYVTKSGTSTTIDGTSIYYNNGAYPTSYITDILTINYYDNYTFDKGAGNSEVAYGVTPITNVKGLATGSKVRVLGTNHWITSLTYYDVKSRPIFVYSHNPYLSTTDKVKTQLTFDGNVTETTATHARTGYSTITTVDTYTYDHANRLLAHKQRINGTGIQEVITDNDYDELGQLASKGVGGKTTQARLQTVDYVYNIRGWLKNINNPSSIGNDLFAFKIGYNEDNNPLYNGNISLAQWRTANTDNSLKSYNYTYDALSRILTATDNTGRYNLSGVSYDKNGNIITLNRKGHIVEIPVSGNSTHFGTMDSLTYTYQNSSNKLLKVSDAIVTLSTVKGEFKDDHNYTTPDLTDDYTYDANGNMLRDYNKGISSNILYNHLNLPTQVTLGGGNIQYVYDATGVKLKKIVSTGGNTEYAGNNIYENGTLKFFSHPEGYVEPDGQGNYDYIYQYKDHLGNIRLSYKDNNHSAAINEFYDFNDSVDGWSSPGNGGSVNNNSQKLNVNIVNKWNSTSKFISITPGQNLHIEFDFERGNMQYPVFYVLERINGVWEPGGNRDAIYNMQDGHYVLDLTLTGDYVRLYFEKGASTDDGTLTTSYVDNFKVTQNDLEIIEENNYYPFGLKHKGYNYVSTSSNIALKRMFGGKEYQDELGLGWYDITARNYDPALGRWMNLDPLAEQMRRHSPYNYAFNNPIFFQDPDGMMPCPTGDCPDSPEGNSGPPPVDSSLSGNDVIRSVSAEGAYTGIKTAVDRKSYINQTKNVTSEQRTKLKVDMQSKEPAVTKAFREAARPASNEVNMPKTNPTSTNAKFDKAASTMGKVGKGFVVVGALASANNIANAENKGEAVATESGAWVGAIAGGEILGTAGAALGPWGAAGGAVVGSVIGGIAGESAVEGIIESIKNPKPYEGQPIIICFVEGTQITMSDFQTKNIEDIENGDLIKTYNIELNQLENKEVILTESSSSEIFIEIVLEDGTKNINTLTHPYYIKDKGWSSYDSGGAIKKYGIKVEEIKVGDIAFKINNDNTVQEVKIVKIKIIEKKMKTYNLSNIKDNHNFFANGILVHNRS